MKRRTSKKTEIDCNTRMHGQEDVKNGHVKVEVSDVEMHEGRRVSSIEKTRVPHYDGIVGNWKRKALRESLAFY